MPIPTATEWWIRVTKKTDMQHQPTTRRWIASVLACVFATSAQAISPYVLPLNFDARPGTTLTVDAGFTQKIFIPATPLGDTSFFIIQPNGSHVPINTVHHLQTRTVLEYALPTDEKTARGTWRISSGPRLGRIFRSWEVNGKTERASSPEQALPAGAKLLTHYQTVGRAESYVTVGAPTREALKPHGKGLEIIPITHPSDLYTGESFEFIVHFDGQPVAGNTLDIYRSNTGRAESEHTAHSLTTDAQGRASFPLKQSGLYQAYVRHDSKAPKGAAAPTYGNRYALTFRVLER